jgi:peptidoglycan/LPS O-acetylase OafA/YrhL
MNTRTDIQVLRGWAVLLVLLYHAKIGGGIGSGYLGVDVFFVISGFLITKLIKDGITHGDFSFKEFYFRRAKRLLPAAYTTFFVTVLATPFFLTSEQMADFKGQLIGALGFVANIVLRSQAGYFSPSADLMPLLHIWSLSLEEQYYFVLPALLVFTPRRLWKAGALALVLASLTLCLLLGTRKPAVAFYLLPTRAWELGLGSIGALFVRDRRLATTARVLFFPAVAAVLALPLMPAWGDQQPGPGALVLCAATLMVILREHENLFNKAIGRALARVGDISYSLYLVHWPLFAFLNNAWIGDGEKEAPLKYRLVALALSFVLGYLLHRFVEVPFRRASWPLSASAVLRTGAAALGIVAISSALAIVVAPGSNYADRLRPNFGFSPACESGSSFTAPPECRNSDAPEIMVWGDSFAMHLVPGIAANAKVIEATRSACGPFLGLALINKDHSQRWAADCIGFNDSVLEYLKSSAPTVKTVVLSSPLNYLLAEDGRALERNGGILTERPSGQAIALGGLRRTVDAVRATGRRVVLVAPPPTGGFDSARCLERKHGGQVSLGVADNCNISLPTWRREQADVNELLQTVQADVGVVRMSQYLCGVEHCLTSIDGVLVFRDREHLSYEGSVLVAKSISLNEQIDELAR